MRLAIYFTSNKEVNKRRLSYEVNKNNLWTQNITSHSNTEDVIVTPHERSECIQVDCGITNLIHDRRSCVDFTLEVEANVARCVHSSVNKSGVKCNSGL